MQFRLTRPSKYPPNTSPVSMQGYYLSGNTFKEALAKMSERFPNEEFDIQLWAAD